MRRRSAPWPRRHLLAALVAALLGATSPAASAPAGLSDASSRAAVGRPVGHVDIEAAALLLSGPRGGDIDGTVTCGVVSTAGQTRSVPFWIETAGEALADGDGPLELQVVAYAMAEDGGVDAFLVRSLSLGAAQRSTLASGGLRIAGVIAVPQSTVGLRVLVRDPVTEAYFLDEAVVPGGAGAWLRAWAPADTGGWVEAVLDESPAAGGAPPGTATPAPPAPAGLAVVAAGGTASIVVETPAGGSAPALRGVVRRGAAVDVATVAIEIVEPLGTGPSGVGLWLARWNVPDLPPGPCSLEVVQHRESGDDLTAQVAVLVMPARGEGGFPAWPWAQRELSAKAGAGGPGAPTGTIAAAAPTGRVAQAKAYRAALGLAAAGRHERAVEALVDLEGSVVASVRRRAMAARGGAGTTERLAAVETGVVAELARERPAAAVAALGLHVGTVASWRRLGEPLGQRHALRVIAVLARSLAGPSSGAPDAGVAAAALATAADDVLDMSSPQEALDLLDLAARLDPGNQVALLGTAAIHEWFGRYREAVAALDAALGQPHPLPEILLRHAVNLRRLDRKEAAERELGSCLSADRPAWIRAVAAQELALALIDDGRPGPASAVLAEASAGAAPDAGVMLLRSFAAVRRGDRAEARRALDAVERRRPEAGEGPRVRYARWPSEAFADERMRLGAAAEAARADLAAALADDPGKATP